MSNRFKNRGFMAALITTVLIALGLGDLSPTLTPALTEKACEAVECPVETDGS